MLNGIKLLAENLADRLQDRDPESAQSARRICDGLTVADDQIGDLIDQLIPVNLTANELAGALEHMIETIPEVADLHYRVRVTGEHPVRDNTVITPLYHIACEAVINAIEHGEASSLRIHFHEGIDEIRLEIEDDGQGFDSDPESVKGMGLQIMEYRAHIIGATLHIDSAPDKGTRIRCILPQRSLVAEDL